MRREILFWLALAGAVFAACLSIYNQSVLEQRIRDRDSAIDGLRSMNALSMQREAQTRVMNDVLWDIVRKTAPGGGDPVFIPKQQLPVTPKD